MLNAEFGDNNITVKLVYEKKRRLLVPNLFILGAGKCGTTSLHVLLGRHPDVHLNAVKEPTFFCSYFQVIKNPVEYFRLFDSNKKYRVDSSHAYMSNPETPPILSALFPAAKFIVIMRSPKQRAYSLYRHMRRFLHEDGLPYENLSTFEEALNAESDRFNSIKFAQDCRHYFWNFMYCNSTFYDVQLQRYLRLYDIRQFHFLTLAELAKRPIETSQALARFLEIDGAPLEQFVTSAYNQDGDFLPFSSDADAHMEARFQGLTRRVDEIVGRRLDWSM